jgi:ribosomal-protein-alanine N-acetyltransferase
MIESDTDKIALLEKQIFSDAWTKQSIYETFCQKQAFVTVAEVDGVPVGYCIIYFALDEGEIARIAVDEFSRRQGLGSKLLDYTCKCCVEKQLERLLLDVRESNESARAFYKKYGFVEDGVRKNFYDCPKEHAILMSKALTTFSTMSSI